MPGGSAGKRKMSCPPEAIKESLDKFVSCFVQSIKKFNRNNETNVL